MGTKKNYLSIIILGCMLSACSSSVRKVGESQNNAQAEEIQKSGSKLELSWEEGNGNQSVESNDKDMVYLPHTLPGEVEFTFRCEECEFVGLKPDFEARMYIGTDSLEMKVTQIRQEGGKIFGVFHEMMDYFKNEIELKRNLEITIRPSPAQTVVKRFDLKMPPPGIEFQITKFSEVATLGGLPAGFSLQSVSYGIMRMDLVLVLSYQNNQTEAVEVEFPRPKINHCTEDSDYYIAEQLNCAVRHELKSGDRAVDVSDSYFLMIDGALSENVRAIAMGEYQAPDHFRFELAPGQRGLLAMYVKNSELNGWINNGYPYEKFGVGRFLVRCDGYYKGSKIGKGDEPTWVEVPVYADLPIGRQTNGVQIGIRGESSVVNLKWLGAKTSRPVLNFARSVWLF